MNIFKKYSIKNFKKSVNKYGYKYRTRDLILQFLGIIISIIIVGVLSKLEYKYIGILIFVGFLLTPIVILAIFKSLHSIKRFAILSDYLTNIIPIFLQKTKISYTLKELREISSYDMKESIDKAIFYLDNTKDDVNIYENSLKIIEKNFNNSRLGAVHKLLVDVEKNNSISFKDMANDMIVDIENWIKRTYNFQKELKSRKTKLLLLCLAILFMNSIFIALYNSNEYFAGFTNNLYYQLFTTVFICIIMIIATIILVKLNGNWLVDDISNNHDKDLKVAYTIYKDGKTNNLVYLLFTIVFLIGGVYCFLINEKLICAACVIFAIIGFSRKDYKLKEAYKKINKNLMYEFPKWLRDVCLKVNDMTVLNAIESTLDDVSYPLKIELINFLKKAKKDPTSIKPYNEFLSEYKLDDAHNSMKVLYSINNVSKKEIKNRVSSLIVRNQELLATSEKINNDDEIMHIEAIAYLPTLVFCVQMMCSMFLMFSYMMANIQGAILF